MKIYEVIAFDLDGTLTEPSKGLVASFKFALDKMNIDYGCEENLKKFIGPPLREVWQETYGLSRDEGEKAVQIFRGYFAEYGWWNNEMYDGIPELLETLKSRGKKIILATSKPEIFAKKILELFKIDKYFDFIGGASTDTSRDKKHQVLEYSLKSVGVTSLKDKNKCILVGDRKFDAEGAKICNIDSLGVLYGHGSYEEISTCGFTHFVKTVKDVEDFLK